MSERVTHKTATILISAGGRSRTFKSLNEVPPDLRERLAESTSGPYSATLLIADQNGRREIVRSLQGQPSAIESRWIRSFAGRNQLSTSSGGETEVLSALPGQVTGRKRWRHIAELALLAGIGLCLWLMAAWK